jgi:DNA polymerase-3 subunit delta'
LDNFQLLVGQSPAVELLQAAIVQGRLAPAYLFTGYEGVGRSLGAYCFAKCILSKNLPLHKQERLNKQLLDHNHPDCLWVEPTYLHQGQRIPASEADRQGLKRKSPPQIRIEQIREISQFLSRSPLEAERMVAILEDAHTLTEGAANGLLKTLEEPGQATLILIAPSPESLIPTLVSRCQTIPFYRLSSSNLVQILRQQGYSEIETRPDILALAQGSPGAAIAAWHHLQSLPDGLAQQLMPLPCQPLEALRLAKEIDSALDTEMQLWLVDYWQSLLWDRYRQPELIQLLDRARRSLLAYVQPLLVWECTLLDMLTIQVQLLNI